MSEEKFREVNLYVSCALAAILVSLLVPVSVVGYFNVGLGYNFGATNNYMIRLGYEMLESPAFAILADYIFNARWDISIKLLLAVTEQLLVGPGVSIIRPLGQTELKTDIEALVSLKLNSLLQVSAGVPVTRLSTSLADILFVGLRFFVPEPSGSKLRDKLYVEFSYLGQNIKVLIGLLEP